MIKTVKHGSEARESLKKGIDILADAVKATLGPKGRNVIINRGVGDPIITKDGVTVAKSIEVEDPIENTGTQMIKNVALKTAEIAGDGTTTATVLAQAIMNAGLEKVNAGSNPMEIKKGIDLAVSEVVKSIKAQSIDIGAGVEKILQVAMVSTNNDRNIAEMIANAMFKMGKTGIINVEDSTNEKTSISISKGMVIDEGLVHPIFVTNQAKQRGEYDDCLIMIYDKKISNWKSLIRILDYAVGEGKPLLIIAEEVEMSAMNILGKNIVENQMKFGVIKLPYVGELRTQALEDIAIVCGATIIRDGHTALEKVTESFLGHATKVISDRTKTTIIGGQSNPIDLTNRIQQLEAAIEEKDPDQNIEMLKDRLAKLTNGIATMYVGAATEVEMNEKKDRIDDAIHAVKAAMQEGIVPGGGLAYLRSRSALDLSQEKLTYDEGTGVDIIYGALAMPIIQICNNAGVNAQEVIEKLQVGNGDFGYNARTNTYEKLFDAGIVDPAMVARVALENAASIAGLLLTTEALVMNVK